MCYRRSLTDSLGSKYLGRDNSTDFQNRLKPSPLDDLFLDKEPPPQPAARTSLYIARYIDIHGQQVRLRAIEARDDAEARRFAIAYDDRCEIRLLRVRDAVFVDSYRPEGGA